MKSCWGLAHPFHLTQSLEGAPAFRVLCGGRGFYFDLLGAPSAASPSVLAPCRPHRFDFHSAPFPSQVMPEDAQAEMDSVTAEHPRPSHKTRKAGAPIPVS